jgi:hypothetical protein
MADVQFAPPLQRLTSPPPVAPVPPPPPPPAPTAAPAPRLSASVPVVRNTSNVPTISLQDIIQPTKTEVRPLKRKKKRGKKLLTMVVFLGLVGGTGYFFRNAAPIQKLLGRPPAVAPLPTVPFVRPSITSAEYSITLSAVDNGVPNNVTTKVQEDYANAVGESTIESQTGGAFTTTQEIRTRDFLFHPGPTPEGQWSRQPRVPDSPSPFDAATFIPMIDDIIDQPLREAMQPTASKSTVIDGMTITTLTYALDRARVPEIAPAIFARIPWLFDVPNAMTLTVEVSYDESGLVRHLSFGVDPPQPGTGVGATWVTNYSMDITSLNTPVSIVVPVDAVDVAVGTP